MMRLAPTCPRQDASVTAMTRGPEAGNSCFAVSGVPPLLANSAVSLPSAPSQTVGQIAATAQDKPVFAGATLATASAVRVELHQRSSPAVLAASAASPALAP